MVYRVSNRLLTHVAVYVLFVLILYFLLCDYSFFSLLDAERNRLLASNHTEMASEYSVKLRMLPPLDHYVYLPLCRWFNTRFGISDIPGMCPNAVTLLHFVIAVCCGRYFASTSLLQRRMACVAFEIRSCLDVLDGVVYRAQSKRYTFVSGWGSSGYVVDGLADVFGSLFIMLGIVYRYNKCPPPKQPLKGAKQKQINDAESGKKLSSSSSSSSDSESMIAVERHSRAYAIGLCAFVAVSVVARSKTWDHFTHTYHTLLEVHTSTVSQRTQMDVLNYPSTWFCMWLWRIQSADAFLTLTLIIIFFDKLWQGVRISACVVIPNLIVIWGITHLHVVYVRDCLRM